MSNVICSTEQCEQEWQWFCMVPYIYYYMYVCAWKWYTYIPEILLSTDDVGIGEADNLVTVETLWEISISLLHDY